MTTASTILIVDDQPIGREALQQLLATPDYNLAFAANGFEALHLAAELMPDLILLDVMMPDMDGFEVCRRLRADPRLAEVPVVLVTALDDRDSRLTGINAGADDFISKPVDRAELRARVKAITRLNRYRRLVSQRQQFAWVVEQADDGYVLLDTNDTIQYANPQAQQWLDPLLEAGNSPQEKFLALAGREYRLEPAEAWKDWPAGSTTEPQPSRYLVRPESRTAPALWLQVTVLRVHPDTQDELLIRLRDITASMTARRDIRSFHGVIQHKLRTPFVAMLGGLELLALEATTLPPAEIADLAAEALQGAQRFYGAVEDILQYLNALHVDGAPRGCPVSQLLPLVTSICADLAITRPTVTLMGDVDQAKVQVSSRTLEMILWELLENTQKFHPVHEPVVQVKAWRSGQQQLTLSVTDDGIHLTPEQLTQVWEPYYQGEKFSTGETPGMGLGLSLVAALTWEAGGECRIKNRADGPGVVVELTLPLID